ncbi:hypothetical protein J4E85_009556 [Alternaria conjuncta]|uniref:uncharacterized protein n=1 Tax=Alternaria conjuncta TaxID=181017 RepID=UPI00221EE935|nr:uncharacterized protein J4E85_009556 [Alternaria conjuncta]KAI4919295.1 hypothetical protein J4E85_009556 [Alternaria conjuncta]
MGVDASAVPTTETPLPWLVHDKGPLHLAIVVTLVLTALLVYSLRAFTRGKLLRSFGIDDGLMVLAALCTIGIFITFTGVVELGLGQQQDDYVLPASKTVQMGPWMWALNSFIIFGLGLVKLSAAFTLLPLTSARRQSYLQMGRTFLLICLILLLLGLFVCAVAIIRTRTVYTSWGHVGHRNNFDLNFTTWGMIEFLAAMIAVNLSTLVPLGRAIRDPLDTPRKAPRVAAISGPIAGSTVHLIHGDVDDLVPSYSESYESEMDDSYNSYNSRYSGQTVIYRPDTAYFPSHGHNNNSLTRFHDDESNLDFDIEAPSTRSSPRRVTKPGPSSRFSVSTVSTRRVSDWSQLSGFTYSPPKDSDADFEKAMSGRARISAAELEEIVKSLGLKRQSSNEIWDKEIGLFEEKSEDGGSSVAPTIYLEDDEDAVDSAGVLCTCPAPRVRNGDAGDSALQSEADSSEITVIRIRGTAKCSLHKPLPRIRSREWLARG